LAATTAQSWPLYFKVYFLTFFAFFGLKMAKFGYGTLLTFFKSRELSHFSALQFFCKWFGLAAATAQSWPLYFKVYFLTFFAFFGLKMAKFGGKKFLKNFIFYHPFESINFQPAGFLAFKEKSGPLLQPYL
jgi:hypothetical protein